VDVYAVNVHRSPDASSPAFASIQYGQRYMVTGQSSSGDWVSLCCVRGQTGWVRSNLVKLVAVSNSNQ
jgi:hypothetical protein